MTIVYIIQRPRIGKVNARQRSPAAGAGLDFPCRIQRVRARVSRTGAVFFVSRADFGKIRKGEFSSTAESTETVRHLAPLLREAEQKAYDLGAGYRCSGAKQDPPQQLTGAVSISSFPTARS